MWHFFGSFLLNSLEVLFVLLMLCILLGFLISLLFCWGWAQQMSAQGRSFKLAEVLSIAGVEWGALMSLCLCHLVPLKRFFEAPPLSAGETLPKQYPVIFVPSLHTGAQSFHFLFWRLKKNFWNSLWPFQWKSFLESPALLEDQLRAYIEDVIRLTGTTRFRIISFGSSRPLVSRILDQCELKAYCDQWIAISAPERLSAANQFLSTQRVRQAYQLEQGTKKLPDLLIIGENDFLCYPRDCFGEGKSLLLPQVGHFAPLLHSTTTQTILRELNQ